MELKMVGETQQLQFNLIKQKHSTFPMGGGALNQDLIEQQQQARLYCESAGTLMITSGGF